MVYRSVNVSTTDQLDEITLRLYKQSKPEEGKLSLAMSVIPGVLVLCWGIHIAFCFRGWECKDKYRSNACQMFKKYDACKLSEETMKRTCRKTCGFCKEECKDLYPSQCLVWKRHNSCITHRSLLKKWCKKSCGHCRSNAPPVYPCESSRFGCCWDKKTRALGPNEAGCPVCFDRLGLCSRFKQDCVHGRNKVYVLKNCPRTCKICPSFYNQGQADDATTSNNRKM